MTNTQICFKDWLRDVFCGGDIERDEIARTIWTNTPDDAQDYRSLDLHFAIVEHGWMHNLFAALWDMYAEHIDFTRSQRIGGTR